ncbi:hypothetical protein V8D89_001263 [Ganoderma adspersum]
MPQPRRTLWTPGCDNRRSVGGCTAWKGPQWQSTQTDGHVPRTDLLVVRALRRKSWPVGSWVCLSGDWHLLRRVPRDVEASNGLPSRRSGPCQWVVAGYFIRRGRRGMQPAVHSQGSRASGSLRRTLTTARGTSSKSQRCRPRYLEPRGLCVLTGYASPVVARRAGPPGMESQGDGGPRRVQRWWRNLTRRAFISPLSVYRAWTHNIWEYRPIKSWTWTQSSRPTDSSPSEPGSTR